MGAHTYESTVKYDVARDLLNGRRAALSEQIALEEARPAADALRTEQLPQSMGAVAIEINRLDVTDDAMLDAVIAANQRT